MINSEEVPLDSNYSEEIPLDSNYSEEIQLDSDNSEEITSDSNNFEEIPISRITTTFYHGIRHSVITSLRLIFEAGVILVEFIPAEMIPLR